MLEITLVNKHGYHSVWPCNYEQEIDRFIYPLEPVMANLGIPLVIANVHAINPDNKLVALDTQTLSYDALVLATGSQLKLPQCSVVNEQNIFDIDTFKNAKRLQGHIHHILQNQQEPGAQTAVIVGAGFTGLEIAAELSEKLNVILIDRNSVGHSLGEAPSTTIKKALSDLKINTISNVTITHIDQHGVKLSNGESILTQTIVWTTGLMANPLAQCFKATYDDQNRMHINANLSMTHYQNHFAVGDVVCAKVDRYHDSVMSCQHARPQGKIGGHNAIASLCNQPLIQYQQPDYVTILDLGRWGALCMRGWAREVALTGREAKQVKHNINHCRICPPNSTDKTTLFELAKPEIQPAPNFTLLKVNKK